MRVVMNVRRVRSFSEVDGFVEGSEEDEVGWGEKRAVPREVERKMVKIKVVNVQKGPDCG
jgi:hypothetical protein